MEPCAVVAAGRLAAEGLPGGARCPSVVRLQETSTVAGPVKRYPVPRQVRPAGDREPTRPRRLPARNRDHATAGLRPLMGSEPGMRGSGTRRAGRLAPPADR